MPRPCVKINAKNIVDEYLNAVKDTLPMFIEIDGVIGITLNGGMSRGYADELSEIDLTVYLDSATYKKYTNCKAPIPFGISMINGNLYDIKPVDFSEEEQHDWEHVQLWDASYAKILFDPTRKISSLLEEKLKNKPTPFAASGEMFACWWHYKLAGDIWLRRGDSLQGHFMMNEALKSLLKALFIANSEFIPHEKWLIHMSQSLAWKPDSWQIRLEMAMLMKDSSSEGLRQRQEIISSLWSEIDEYLSRKCNCSSGLRFCQQQTFKELKLLASQKEMSLSDFDNLIGLERLNYPPFYLLLNVENEKIFFNDEALYSITSDQLYQWFYEIVDSLR